MRELARQSARALGIATETDIRDYFRLPVQCARQAVQELAEEGDIAQVQVARLEQACLRAEGRAPCPQVQPRHGAFTVRSAGLEPRPGAPAVRFHYRIEIYTPAPKRQFGYYVLPILVGEDLVGRLCMKADRQNATLRINAAWHEDDVAPGPVAEAISPTLEQMAGWLGLERVEVSDRGNLAKALRTSC
jgi:uncharacterized protein YcaQ